MAEIVSSIFAVGGFAAKAAPFVSRLATVKEEVFVLVEILK